MIKTVITSCLLLALLWSSPSRAGENSFSGLIGLESRAFWNDPRFPGQHDGLNASMLLQSEYRFRSEDSRQRVSVVAHARFDETDSERTHLDLREAYWAYEGDDWDLTLGINKVFWGVTESRHLVDIINQTDAVEDPDSEDKLGQAMINLNLERDWGRVEFYLLPGFRERTFPGPDGRLRTPWPVDTDGASYQSSAGQSHLDLAVRYSHYFGDLDLGVHLFEGTDREPRLIPAETGQKLVPVYDQIRQLGLDLQYTREAWLWKLESLLRDTPQGGFAALVGGFEYTFYGVRESAADLGVLMELLYDGRGPAAPPTAFDRDVFFGTRLAFNDAQDTSMLAGLAVDANTGETFVNIEAERRIGDQMKLELRLRGFFGAEPGEALHAFERDDYLQLRLNWYF
jgi:hypothetical protein